MTNASLSVLRARLESIRHRIADIEARFGVQPADNAAPPPLTFQQTLNKAFNVAPPKRRPTTASPHLPPPALPPMPPGKFEAVPSNVERLIDFYANRHGVDAALVRAVMKAESDFNPDTVSSAGAMGLMQLMPENVKELGIRDPFDPEQNIDGGVRHLKQMLDRFDDVTLAVAAYNAGPGNVTRYGGIPPFRETQQYVRRVMRFWQEAKPANRSDPPSIVVEQ
jgi:soluble lytic murein transglycosylase-like protein